MRHATPVQNPVAHYTSLGLRGIYQDFSPFRSLGPFCLGYQDRKGKISSEVKPTDLSNPLPTQLPSLTKLVESQGQMMKMGSLSEAYIATILSGNEAIVPRPMKTEGGTRRLIYTTTPKPVSMLVRLSFGKTFSCKALAAMTYSNGNLTGPSCL